jgi:two-component system, OmpR family, response regulator MprA
MFNAAGQSSMLPPEPANFTPSSWDAKPPAGASILVVDDTPSAREPLARLLRLSGYRATSAADGAEALALIDRQTPDLILLDLMMPRVDGVTFLQRMRKDPRFVRVPVILVTAADTPDQLTAARQYNVADCLLKAAFTVPELLDRIARTLKPA